MVHICPDCSIEVLIKENKQEWINGNAFLVTIWRCPKCRKEFVQINRFEGGFSFEDKINVEFYKVERWNDKIKVIRDMTKEYNAKALSNRV